MSASNLPPGVTGCEPEIVGEDDRGDDLASAQLEIAYLRAKLKRAVEIMYNLRYQLGKVTKEAGESKAELDRVTAAARARSSSRSIRSGSRTRGPRTRSA